MGKDLNAAKIHFIAGKGGVGKTALAKALAHHFAHQHKTLLVSLSEEESGLAEPEPAAFVTIAPNLSYLKIFPDQTIYEYLSLKIPPKILKKLQSQRLFRVLCAAMPGLSDLTRLGKIWFHADPSLHRTDHIFEKIVVDMPSTGFVARFLSIPSVAFDAVKIGPVAQEAKMMRDYLRNPDHARLHLVALPQELVVLETIKLYKEIKQLQAISLGWLWVNKVLSIDLPQIDESALEPNCPQLKNIFLLYKTRNQLEASQKLVLKENLALPTLVLPEHFGVNDEQHIVACLIKDLGHEFLP